MLIGVLESRVPVEEESREGYVDLVEQPEKPGGRMETKLSGTNGKELAQLAQKSLL